MLRLKLKAGALQLTTFIIVVIALLLTAFILLVHTHQQFQIQSDFIVETTKLSNQGINYAINNAIRLNDTTRIELTDNDYKSLSVHRNFWGVFEKLVSSSKIKKRSFQKIALIGSKQPKNDRIALYVQENNKPLVLVGDTKIEGLSYLPKEGVRPGYIAGHSYYGSKLIYGPTRIASRLPKLSLDMISQIDLVEQVSSVSPQNQFLNIEAGKRYSNSFAEPLQVVFSDRTIAIEAVSLTGHILIHSTTKIVIRQSSKLKDVLLIAPEIEIESHVSGNFQAIASEGIHVGNDVQLNYPSALVVKEAEGTEQLSPINPLDEPHSIRIDNNSTVKGLVVFLGQEKPNNYKPQIVLKEDATIYGEVYNNQNTELQGIVYGSVYTNNFIANQSGSIYQNHIYNAVITANELPRQYAGLLFTNSKKNILKWLY